MYISSSLPRVGPFVYLKKKTAFSVNILRLRTDLNIASNDKQNNEPNIKQDMDMYINFAELNNERNGFVLFPQFLANNYGSCSGVYLYSLFAISRTKKIKKMVANTFI